MTYKIDEKTLWQIVVDANFAKTPGEYYKLLIEKLAQSGRKPSPYKDRNGNQIFEGDTVKGFGEHTGQSEVFFEYEKWQPFDYLNDYDGNNYEIVSAAALPVVPVQGYSLEDMENCFKEAIELTYKNREGMNPPNFNTWIKDYTRGATVLPVPMQGYSMEQMEFLLNEAKKIIKNWHNMGSNGTVDVEEMWRIYDTHAPEMKRLNSLAASLPAADAVLPEQWVSVEDTLPTNNDADDRGYVMVYLRQDRQWGWPTKVGFGKFDRVHSKSHTHWSKIPPPPKS